MVDVLDITSIHTIFYMTPKEKSRGVKVQAMSWPKDWVSPAYPPPQKANVKSHAEGVHGVGQAGLPTAGTELSHLRKQNLHI